MRIGRLQALQASLLKVGFLQASAFGVTSAEEVGQVEDDPFDQRPLADVQFELLGLVVSQGGQNINPVIADADIPVRVGLAVRFVAVG